MENLRELLKHAKKFVKKPIPVKAIQMDSDFEVETLEGKMKGRAGDYLVEGVDGELYPCRKEIFERTYEPVDEFRYGIIELNDKHKTVLNLRFLSKYFIRIYDNPEKLTLYIQISVNGLSETVKCFYWDKKTLVKDKETLIVLIGKWIRRQYDPEWSR